MSFLKFCFWFIQSILQLAWVCGCVYIYQFWGWNGWGCFWLGVVGILILSGLEDQLNGQKKDEYDRE